jgi:hypothetical protein
VKKRRPFETPRSRLPAATVPVSLLVRTIALGALVAIAAAWALARHYSRELPPLLVSPDPATPTAAPAWDIEAGEVPVPEMLEPDAS